jgi:NADH dehydrogenase
LVGLASGMDCTHWSSAESGAASARLRARTGFGGLEAARKLQRADVDVTVIDKTNHHLFQPLLYQVATAGLAAPRSRRRCASLFRKQPNVTTLLGEVSGIDPATQCVHLANGDPAVRPPDRGGRRHAQLLRARRMGAGAPGLKTLADAFEIRRRVLLSFEAAEITADPEHRRALAHLRGDRRRPDGRRDGRHAGGDRQAHPAGEFRRIDPGSAQVLLVEGGPRVLQAMPESLSASALEQLESPGRRSAAQRARDGHRRHRPRGAAGGGADAHRRQLPHRQQLRGLGGGRRGLAAGPQLGTATGAECDRAGRVKVEPDLSLAGYPEISVVGDLAAAMSHARASRGRCPACRPAPSRWGAPRPPTSCGASRAKPTQPFRYADYGNLATIGRNSAVVDLGTPLRPAALQRTARVAVLAVRAHLLPDRLSQPLVVMIDWASPTGASQRYARVVADVQGKGES